MMKKVKNIMAMLIVLLGFSELMAQSATVGSNSTGVVDPLMARAAAKAEFVVTPRVTFDSGYTTRANHLGLQFQKNSAFVASTVALENSVLTPQVGVTYFIRGESAEQAVFDANVSRRLGNDFIALTAVGGVEKRMIGGAFSDTLTAYGGVRLNKFPVLTVLATPYVRVARDFDTRLFGATVGVDRTFTLGSVELTPRAEAYLYDKHTSYTAGGTLAYTGVKYLKPYIDVGYVTTDTALAARKFEGNLAFTTGVKLSF
jgi:hypothetical protein